MKQAKLKSVLWLPFILLITSLFCISNAYATSAKKREINSRFPINKGDLLRMNCSYGNLTVSHWDKDEITIQVFIECKADNDRIAQRILDNIQININKSNNVIDVSTFFKKQNENNSSIYKIINFNIQMPNYIDANVDWKYGNIYLPKVNNGNININLKYGNIKAGSFSKPLTINAKYSNLEVENLTSAVFDLAYMGNTSIESAQRLNVNDKYSSMNVNEAEEMSAAIKYSNLKINRIKTLEANAQYSNITISKAEASLIISMLSYGNLRVNELSSNFSKVNINAKYSDIDLSISRKAEFNLSATQMKYANCKINGFNITQSKTDEQDNSYFYEINHGQKASINFNGNNYTDIRINAITK